jgi:hypothetical protein
MRIRKIKISRGRTKERIRDSEQKKALYNEHQKSTMVSLEQASAEGTVGPGEAAQG